MKSTHLLPVTLLIMGGIFHPLGAQDAPSVLWTRTYGGSQFDDGYSVQQTSDGGFVLAGFTDSFLRGQRGALL